MSVEAALARVSQEIGAQSVPLAEELTLTIAELSFIGDRSRAFENLAQRTGMATVKSVVTSLVQSERYGTPIGVALRVLAQENRDDRMAMAEKKAAALPPKLTVPMVGFFLPVIFRGVARSVRHSRLRTVTCPVFAEQRLFGGHGNKIRPDPSWRVRLFFAFWG